MRFSQSLRCLGSDLANGVKHVTDQRLSRIACGASSGIRWTTAAAPLSPDLAHPTRDGMMPVGANHRQ